MHGSFTQRLVVILLLTICTQSKAQIDSSRTLDTVIITKQVEAYKLDGTGAIKSEILNQYEFKKAACCTLSESFESTNTVEISSSDAISGVRKVEMLGLPGQYVSMTRGQMSFIRGVNILTGLGAVPGPMVSNVYVAKGAGSVTNGYEAITGGIDYNLKDEAVPQLFLNIYGNHQGRNEQNAIITFDPARKVRNTTYLHHMAMPWAMDNNGDKFMDFPTGNMIGLGNATKFETKKVEGLVGINYVHQNTYTDNLINSKLAVLPTYQFKNNFSDLELFAKLGIFLPKGNSIGNIFQVQKQSRLIQFRPNTNFQDIYSNQLYFKYTGMLDYSFSETIKTKSGIDVTAEQMTEDWNNGELDPAQAQVYNSNVTENNLGIFSELNIEKTKFNLLIGARLDKNNLYNWFFTPRLHFKYAINAKQAIHIQSGMGRRRPNILSDNFPYLLGNRQFVLQDSNAHKNNGYYTYLSQEKGINSGISYTHELTLFNRKSTVSADLFYTHFYNQWLVDRDLSSTSVIIKSQNGTHSTAAQIDWFINPHRRLELHLSYRYVNAMLFTGNKWQQQAFQAPHRWVNVISYKTRNKWNFNLIWQTNSPARNPNTSKLPENYRRPDKTPWLQIGNFLVQKTIKNFELYGGVENFLNTRQANPIMASNDVSQPFFDPAFAWGPANGRTYFIGVRYSLNKFKK